MKKIFIASLGIIFLLASCNGGTSLPPTPFATPSTTPLPPTVTATVQPSFTPTETFTPLPSPTPTEAWIVQGPGDITVPVILYHRIDISPIDSRYYVRPEKFEAQMKLLHDWGYTSITTSMLIEAINNGASLPPRPFLLTIDDGNLDNYTNAFPIMQKYGFTGVLYLVGNYIGAQGYMDVDQILEMHNAGWEVGSHSMNHLDLTKLEPDALRYEIVESRAFLEDKLGVPVLTFAYPFGLYNDAAIDYIKFAGYIGAMGASGYSPAQGTWNLYNLQRAEIKGNEDAKTFTRFLPWVGDTSFLPADTPTPSPIPSRTPSP
ncbi:MAG: polysaccharide deacetylase family protein [Anaerolineales bacterium]|nr:polysaccharide deacetylase family protein [Anaerolineales bacterium]